MESLEELMNEGSTTLPPVKTGTGKTFKGRRDTNEKFAWENETDLYETNEPAISAIYDYVIKSLPNKDGLMFYELAMGNGNIVQYIQSKGLNIVGTDKYTQKLSVDFIDDVIPDCYDFIITNPPFNKATEFLEKCYETKKPFLLLLPFEYLTTVSRYKIFHEFGVVVYIIFPKPTFDVKGKEVGVGGCAWYYGNSGLVSKGEIVVKHCCDANYISTFTE